MLMWEIISDINYLAEIFIRARGTSFWEKAGMRGEVSFG
jgi:hypothetical protein